MYFENIDYEYIFTDFDDTLIHTSYANYLAYKKAIYYILGINIVYIDERFTHSTLLEIEKNSNKVKNIINCKNQYYNEFLKYTYINNNLLDVLKNLNADKIMLVTNGNKDRVDKTLKYHNIQSFFYKQFYIKPANSYSSKYLDVFNKITENNFNINIENIIIFENSDLEILKAINSGFKADKIFKIPVKVYTGEFYDAIYNFQQPIS